MRGGAVRGVRFEVQLWSQSGTWPEFITAAEAADRAGWDAVRTWDHLTAIMGPWDQSVLEGWVAISAVAARTTRVRVGLLVGANTLRNPGLTAKLAATLDQVSGGRADLGLGAAYIEREHDAFGIDFGASAGERLDRLEEAVALIRRLLDGERITASGATYAFRDALVLPRPVQPRLPIIIGGSGPQKTLRIVARHADGWNTAGELDFVRARDATLREHCAAIGRDPESIERSVSFPLVLRDDPDDAAAAFAAACERNGMDGVPGQVTLLGSPGAVADRIRPFVAAGFRTIVARLPAPYDAETIARVGELREALAG